VVPNLTKLVSTRRGAPVNGIYLLTLLHQEELISVLGMILEWLLTQYSTIEQQQGPKLIFYARTLQQSIKLILTFFQALLKLQFLVGSNMQSYCLYFRA
jgi:hypothetical protein